MGFLEEAIKFIIKKTKPKQKPVIGGKSIKQVLKLEVSKKLENVEEEYEKEIEK